MGEARAGARAGIDVGGPFTEVAREVGGRRFTVFPMGLVSIA